MNRIGGIQCGLDIWETVISPSLLNNSGTWTGITPALLEELEGLFLYFIRRLLQVPKSTPKPALSQWAPRRFRLNFDVRLWNAYQCLAGILGGREMQKN